jgi:hypothetical protein
VVEALKRVILGAVRHKWVLDYVVPVGQLAVSLAWKRAARRVRLEPGDMAVGPELLLTSVVVWLAVLAAINQQNPTRLRAANLELAFSLLWLTLLVFAALPGFIRLLWLESDGKTPTPAGVAVPIGLGILALVDVFFVSTHWLLPGT